MPVFVKFWGARGSIPTPASWTRVYGGNTSCVEIRCGESVFVCDAGSGIRELGKDLLTRAYQPSEIHLFLTHTHWDHIQGFPFFVPAYLSNKRIRLYGTSEGDQRAYQLLSGQMTSSYFPVTFSDLGAQIVSDHLNDGEKCIDSVHVRSFPLAHSSDCFGYGFEADGKKIVYATDNEIPVQPEDVFPDSKHTGGLRRVPESLLDTLRNADLLIADAQYTDEQYALKKGWGHSSCLTVADLAIQANVKNLALFHHDPESTDWNIDSMVKSCRRRAARHSSDISIFAAREGVELKF